MTSDFVVTETEVSRGLWCLPLLQPLDDDDWVDVFRGYMEWSLRQHDFYEITPAFWVQRGKQIEHADEVYFLNNGTPVANGAVLPTLREFDAWLAA